MRTICSLILDYLPNFLAANFNKTMSVISCQYRRPSYKAGKTFGDLQATSRYRPSDGSNINSTYFTALDAHFDNKCLYSDVLGKHNENPKLYHKVLPISNTFD